MYETIPPTGHHSLGVMPSSAQLQTAGLIPLLSTGGATTAGGDEMDTGQGGSSINQQASGNEAIASTITIVVHAKIPPLLAQLNNGTPANGKHVLIAPGLPTLSQKIIDRIKLGDYVDFNELPPARGLSKAVPPHLEGQVVVVQAEDLAASQKLIPNFETWSHAVLCPLCCSEDFTQANLTGGLMAYFYSIATMARKHPWPSWILYDQAFT